MPWLLEGGREILFRFGEFIGLGTCIVSLAICVSNGRGWAKCCGAKSSTMQELVLSKGESG